jgi:hypothetical protein
MCQCSVCGIKLEKLSPEEEKEMLDELGGNFPGYDVENCDVVCDDCYKKVMSRFN